MPRLPIVTCLAALALSACGPLPGEFGSGCAENGECNTGLCATSLPGGYCTQACEAGGTCPESAACAPAGGANYCLQTCILDFECRDGYVCEGIGDTFVCRPKCTADTDCLAQGATCGQDGHCTSGTEKVGAACQANNACEIGRCEGGFPGGYCTRVCSQTGEGAEGQDCPSESVCARVGEATGMCLATCSGPSGCRDGYLCDQEGSSAGVCRPRCAGNADCGLGYSCDTAKGLCVEGGAAPRQIGASCGVGKTCTATDATACDADCDSNYCLTEQTELFPGGTCSDDCTSSASVCPSGSICVETGETDVCMQRCQTNFDCRAPYFCKKLGNSEDSICIPRCTAVAMCDATEECDAYSGACVPKGQVGQVQIDQQSLGSVSVESAEDSANATSEISFDVPADAISFALVLEAPFGGDVNLFSLTSPSGASLFDYNKMWTSAVRAFPGDSATAVLYPNSPRLSVEKGRYKARFIVFNSPGGSAKASVIYKRSAAPAVGSGILDLNLWFVGTDSLTATTAKTDASFQAMLTEFWSIYSQSNIARGTVTYLDAPADKAARLAIIDSTEGPNSELRELFKLSKGAPNKAMNFFFVKEIREDRSGGYITIGMAGGIPGVPVIQGTPTSGVAVCTLDLEDAPKKVAALMAHEGAHWLGLFHVTEASGQLFDTLPDTPECPSSRDRNGNDMVDADECVGVGKENTMFWVLTNNWDLSGNQSFVLLRSPAVR